MSNKRSRGDDGEDEHDEGLAKRGRAETATVNPKKRKLMGYGQDDVQVDPAALAAAAANVQAASAGGGATESVYEKVWQTWDAEGYGDQSDRRYLSTLNELQREEELARRFAYRDTRQLLQRHHATHSGTEVQAQAAASDEDSGGSGAAMRTRRRRRLGTSAKSGKERQRQLMEHAAAVKDGMAMQQDDDDELNSDSDYAPQKKLSKKEAAAAARSAASATASAPDKAEKGDELASAAASLTGNAAEAAELARLAPDDPLRQDVDLEMANSIVLLRHVLESWLFQPFFEKALVGSFVRLRAGAGLAYRLGRVDSVGTTERPYTLGNYRTDVQLNVTIFRGAARVTLNYLSTEPANEDELNVWLAGMRKRGQPVPTKFAVRAKRRQLTALKEQPRTAEEIDEMVRKRRKAQLNAVLSAADRVELVDELEAANEEKDQERVRELEQVLAAVKDAPVELPESDVARLNARIKQENQARLVKAHSSGTAAAPQIPGKVASTAPAITQESKMTPAQRLVELHNFDLGLTLPPEWLAEANAAGTFVKQSVRQANTRRPTAAIKTR